MLTFPYRTFLIVPIIALSACTSGIDRPTRSVNKVQKSPSSWKQAGEQNHGKISNGWLHEFNSPTMRKLVHEAQSNNPGIKSAEANLRASWANFSASDSILGPTINGSGRSTRNINNDGNSSGSYNIGATFSWEPDFWKRLRDQVDIDRVSYESDIHDLRNARLSLAANVARSWCNLITAQQQVELADATLKSFEKNSRIVERNYKAGIPGTSALAVQLSRSNVAAAKSTLRGNQLSRNNAARTIELLLGRYPSAEIKSSSTLPTLKRNITAGFPAQVLSRRPDVKAAELAVYISAKRADLARKSLLPRIQLSGGSSSTSSVWKEVFRPSNLVANAAANLTQTIYDGGELKANAQAALEQNSVALHNYADSVLDAANEVEQALATERALREQESFLIEQTKASTLAENQAERDYSEGIDGVGILEILESQRRANTARSSLINIRNNRLQNRINLHLALGGDYETLTK